MLVPMTVPSPLALESDTQMLNKYLFFLIGVCEWAETAHSQLMAAEAAEQPGGQPAARGGHQPRRGGRGAPPRATWKNFVI